MPLEKLDYELNIANIPQEMKNAHAWVNWILTERALGDPEKAPVSSRTGQKAKNNDPSTWSPFQEALARLKGGETDGIGFEVFPPYVGIDLDDCRNAETGEIAPWAVVFIRQLNSYSEVSPSGRGVHIWVKGQLPAFPLVWRLPVDSAPAYMRLRFRPSYISIKRKQSSTRGAYLTMTGQRLEGVPATVEERSAELERFCDRTRRPGETSAEEEVRRLREENERLKRLLAEQNGKSCS